MNLALFLQLLELGVIVYIAVVDKRLLDVEQDNQAHFRAYWKESSEWNQSGTTRKPRMTWPKPQFSADSGRNGVHVTVKQIFVSPGPGAADPADIIRWSITTDKGHYALSSFGWRSALERLAIWYLRRQARRKACYESESKAKPK